MGEKDHWKEIDRLVQDELRRAGFDQLHNQTRDERSWNDARAQKWQAEREQWWKSSGLDAFCDKFAETRPQEEAADLRQGLSGIWPQELGNHEPQHGWFYGGLHEVGPQPQPDGWDHREIPRVLDDFVPPKPACLARLWRLATWPVRKLYLFCTYLRRIWRTRFQPRREGLVRFKEMWN